MGVDPLASRRSSGTRLTRREVLGLAGAAAAGGLAAPALHPAAARASGTTVTFGTAFAGSPVPITAWYHSREAWGHQFVYGTR